MDVKSAFLYGEIEEEVYVTQPKGFEDPYNPKHVYRVVKALRAWCDEFEVLMKGEFEMSAMGELTFFLGLQVKQLPDGIFISQDKYVKDMLKKFDMESVQTATTPYEVPKHKSKDEPDDAINVHLFRSMIGSLMYLTASRPDIMFVYKKQTVVATSSTEAKYVATASCCGQVLLLVVQVRADDLVSAGGCTLPAGSFSFLLLDWFLLVVDDHNKFAYLKKGKGWEAFEQILDFLNRSHIRYALIYRPTIVFDSLVKQFWATATVRTLEAEPSDIIATIDGNEFVVTESLIRTQLHLADVNGLYEFTLHDVLDGMRAIGSLAHLPLPLFVCPLDEPIIFLGLSWMTSDPSPRPTFDFTTKLFSNIKLNWDGPHMPLVAPMLVVPAGGDTAGAATTVAAGPGPSFAPQVPPVREHTPVREPSPMREPTPVKEPSPRPEPPCPSRHPSIPEDICKGGGDFVSSPQSNEAPQTPAATAGGGAEDSAALTALSLKLDQCPYRVTTLENELGITKKVLDGAVLKLVTRVKRLEGLLQQRKRRLVLSDSEGEDATTTEQEFDLAALHTLASATLGDDSSATAAGPDAETTMPVPSTSTTRRRLRKPFTSFVSAHVSETIPAGVRVTAAATTIPAGSSMDVAVHVAAAPSSSIPTTVDKGKAPMVDNSPPADLLSKQERVLKNLHDSQLGEELAKKIQAEQEAEFAKQQEELAQKAQAERVAFLTEHASGMSDQHHRELDVAQLIYTGADWLDLLAKIATNSALSKQLLGDDVTEKNMNERLGMLLLRKRRELAEQSRVKPMTKTQQRDYMRDFMKNNSASVYNQGWTMKKVKALSIAQLQLEFEYIQQHLECSNLLNFRCSSFRPKPTLDALSAKRDHTGVPQVPAALSPVPADVSVSTATTLAVPADVSVSAITTPEVPADIPVSTATAPEIPVDVSLPAATTFEPADIPVPAVFIAHAAVSVLAEPMVHPAESYMDDPLTAPEHGSSDPTVAAPTSSSSRHRRKHIAKKQVTPIVDVADAAMIKFDSDSDSDDDPLSYASNASWEMVPSPLGSVHAYHNMAGHTKHFTTLREILHMVERTDLQRLLGVVDALYQIAEPDTFALLLWGDLRTLERMLIHRLEVSKLLVGGDLTMAEQLIGFIKSWLVQEQTALGKDKSNPLTVGSILKTTWSSIHHLLTDEVLTSPEQMATDAILELPSADLSRILKLTMYVVPAGSEHSHSYCCVSAGKHSFCCQ
nr:retrotransposon protein, putative, unclassified [Tanacetum cinerariifolium]